MNSPSTIVHGVLLEVFAIGVLVTGEPGSGKSELALELISRGHTLVADDAPEFVLTSAGMLEGRCPAVIRDHLEVRGLGVLNVRALFGDRAVTPVQRLDLILHLCAPAAGTGERLAGFEATREVLGVAVPRLDLEVKPGRNLAVIAETAVRQFKLKAAGTDSTAQFIANHLSHVQRNRS